MGIFGWSYPPGCNSVPGDEPWQCEVCGMVDDCCCPECEVCGVAGDPKCYTARETGGHGMVMNVEQTIERKAADARETAKAERDRAEAEYWASERRIEEDKEIVKLWEEIEEDIAAHAEEGKIENGQLNWSEGKGRRWIPSF